MYWMKISFLYFANDFLYFSNSTHNLKSFVLCILTMLLLFVLITQIFDQLMWIMLFIHLFRSKSIGIVNEKILIKKKRNKCQKKNNTCNSNSKQVWILVNPFRRYSTLKLNWFLYFTPPISMLKSLNMLRNRRISFFLSVEKQSTYLSLSRIHTSAIRNTVQAQRNHDFIKKKSEKKHKSYLTNN